MQPCLISDYAGCTPTNFQNTTKNTTLVVLTFVSHLFIVKPFLTLIRIVNRISARKSFWFPIRTEYNLGRLKSIEK